MERKLGEIFEYNNKWYEVVTGGADKNSCANCAFLTLLNGCSAEVSGRCSSLSRMDRVSVHFEEIPAPGTAPVLPKGSVEKLIGRKLTWKDEPVELK